MDYQQLVSQTLTQKSEKPNTSTDTEKKQEIVEIKKLTPFNINTFKKELESDSSLKNKNFHDTSENVNAYDLAETCIRSIFFRINSYPVENYSDVYLPIVFRSEIGKAIHNFLQQSPQFTENEVILKVPSLKISVRCDALIGNSILVEIKTCNYADYEKIIKNKRPRSEDLSQILVYKTLIEEHLEEIMKQSVTRPGTYLPKLSFYTIQFIYVCHELLADNNEDVSKQVKYATKIKKMLNSKQDQLWFLTTIEIDLTKNDYNFEQQKIKQKTQEVLKFLNKKEIPPMDNSFVDTSQCYFCLFKKVCKTL
jgi:hypothetical protein